MSPSGLRDWVAPRRVSKDPGRVLTAWFPTLISPLHMYDSAKREHGPAFSKTHYISWCCVFWLQGAECQRRLG